MRNCGAKFLSLRVSIELAGLDTEKVYVDRHLSELWTGELDWLAD